MKKLLATITIVSLFAFFIPYQRGYAATDIVNDGTLSTSLEACWEMDEESGTRVDATANGNDLTDNNEVGFGTGIQGNGADLELDLAQFLSRTNANLSSGLKTANTDMSWSFWYDAESLTIDHDIITKWTGSPQRGFIIRIQTDGDIQLFISSDGTSFGDGTVAAGISTTAGLQHVVVTFDVSASTMEVFVDGTSAGTDATLVSSFNLDSTANWQIGDQQAGGTYSDGIIDVVGVWANRVLSSDDVTALYASGAGIPCVSSAVAEATTTPATTIHGNTILFGNTTIQ